MGKLFKTADNYKFSAAYGFSLHEVKIPKRFAALLDGGGSFDEHVYEVLDYMETADVGFWTMPLLNDLEFVDTREYMRYLAESLDTFNGELLCAREAQSRGLAEHRGDILGSIEHTVEGSPLREELVARLIYIDAIIGQPTNLSDPRLWSTEDETDNMPEQGKATP